MISFVKKALLRQRNFINKLLMAMDQSKILISNLCGFQDLLSLRVKVQYKDTNKEHHFNVDYYTFFFLNKIKL